MPPTTQRAPVVVLLLASAPPALAGRAQEIGREAERVSHLKDVKGDVPVTIKALLSAPPIINHFQNRSWLFNFFHLEDL